MAPCGFTLFETALGWCAIGWTARGVCGVRLPEAHAPLTREAMKQRFRGVEEAEPPAEIARGRDGITALLAGESPSLLDVELDLDRVGAFERAVYAATRAIPRGETRSYGQVAAAAGAQEAAQAVGRALGRNPFPVVVPCHRVLAADGRLHGFSAPGGLGTKLKMLAIERALGGAQPALFEGAEAFSLKPR